MTTTAIMDPYEATDYIIDQELASLLGHDFPGCLYFSTPVCTPGAQPPAEPGRSSSAPVVLNFANSEKISPENPQLPLSASPGPRASRNERGATKVSKARRVRGVSQTYDHIMAERRRREQLNQCFVALSAMVPGLKKMDKSSVLGDTINYLKLLQERVQALEEQPPHMESTVAMKRSRIVDDHRNLQQPEIEARVSQNSVLIKIHCQKQKEFLVRVLAEVENLNLTVVNTSVTPFGDLAHHITITAQMDKRKIDLTAEDIVKTLRDALVAAN